MTINKAAVLLFLTFACSSLFFYGVARILYAFYAGAGMSDVWVDVPHGLLALTFAAGGITPYLATAWWYEHDRRGEAESA